MKIRKTKNDEEKMFLIFVEIYFKISIYIKICNVRFNYLHIVLRIGF
jgi:hypothetical protein